MDYQKILNRSHELIDTLTERMEMCNNWSEEKKKQLNNYERHEAKYVFAQVKALIREQDPGSPFLELCTDEEQTWPDDTGQLYHQYMLILHAFNDHLEAFVD
ncbi:hypothetical protein [Spirosoma rhododendri]|uniref:DUF4298 domain-containing protein n=1 Tax=Spirosoma rhododendri TaxID=2728024 RepID=A0A7L5DPD2_9BACT|nr:hypothetical protein [Spirosoma rhododendri]QJD80299.1 hypothetical protein HH216_19130 [Spirosoma rhododendri]